MSIVTVILDTQHILSGGTADKGQLVQNKGKTESRWSGLDPEHLLES